MSKPMLSIWFGNFFEPFYSDPEAVRAGVADVASLGFTSINLDSKPWEDFFARYRGEAASPYVATHELLMAEAASHGLDYTHLALYLCGDNLYPAIRDVPPVRGEEAIRPNGKPMGTYKYWSPKAQATMVDHVRGLLKLYGQGVRRSDRLAGTGEQPLITQTMFEPIPKPSFDAEGRARYLDWLEKRYGGDLGAFNARYSLRANAFTDLLPGEYWLRPEELTWVDCARPSADDFARRTPDFYKWIDNQTYLAHELDTYLATMTPHWRALNLFIEPVLHQWGYFFNPPGQTMWQTGQRALDIYRCAKHVDGALFIAAPLNAENRADAIALSVEASIMRNANRGRAFTAGLYLGRHVNGDVYRVVPPAEAYATVVAAGASAFHVYGYSGLDDGGVMYRLDDTFKDSLRAANRWAAEVIPLLKGPRDKQIALLFPAEMSLFEPLERDHEGRHRMDLLGWYAQFIDLGYAVDILHPDQVAAGALEGYSALVVPTNSLYDLGDNAALEEAVTGFVRAGGTLYHGPHCLLAQRAFAIQEEAAPFDCLQWEEPIIPHGWSTVAFPGCRPLATYIQSGTTAIAQTEVGRGRVFSFGFQYGYAYSRLTMPIVPPQYGKREMHPVVLLKETPVGRLAGHSPTLPSKAVKGLEAARFGNRLVLVNHRASPLDISAIRARQAVHLLPAPEGMLPAHSAVCLELA